MILENKSEYVDWNAKVPVIRYASLDETGCVEHGFSTRLGGVSKGIYRSMNLSYTRGDDKNHVDENFRRFCSAVHMDWKRVVGTDQTHTSNVRVVTEKDAGHGIIRALKGRNLGEELLLPINVLRSGEDVLLDDVHVKEIEKTLQVPVRIVQSNGKDLYDALIS